MPWFFKSKQEKTREEARRRARQLDKTIQRECKYYAKLIPDVLANCGLDYMLPRGDRPTAVESTLLDSASGGRIEGGRETISRWIVD